jgi:cell division protein FtsQ
MTAAPRALAIRQYKKTRIKRAHFTRGLIIFAITMVSLATAVLLGLDYLFRPNVLIVDRLVIKGSFKYLEPIVLQPKIEAELGRNFFTIDLEKIKRIVDSEPWVERSVVRREWPNTLAVELVESVPVMRWKSGGWLTVDGRIVELPNFENSASITVYGPQRQRMQIMRRTHEWSRELEALGLRLISLDVSDWRSWGLVLTEDKLENAARIEVALGTMDLDQRFDRFLLAYRKGLLAPDGGVVFVDARYPDGLAIAGVQSFNRQLPSKVKNNDA